MTKILNFYKILNTYEKLLISFNKSGFSLNAGLIMYAINKGYCSEESITLHLQDCSLEIRQEIKRMKKNNIIFLDNKQFKLTPYGESLLKKFISFQDKIDLIAKEHAALSPSLEESSEKFEGFLSQLIVSSKL